MKTTSRRFALLLCVVSLADSTAQKEPAAADTILINGKIITMDGADSIAQAVAIRNGKILAIGSRESIMPLAGPSTRMIDLQNRAATPGLIDSHLHFASVDPIYSIDLSAVHNMEEVRQAVAKRVVTAKPGQWITGQGWDEGKLAERRYIFASDLNSISPRNPVWLEHTTGHYGVANSVALKLAHITGETKNPPAGTIDRDEHGQPTGVLKEAQAVRLVVSLIPPYTRAQMREGYIKAMAALNQEGITAIKDPGMGGANWAVYSELRDQHKLSVHLFALWSGGATLASAQEAVNHIRALPRGTDDLLIAGGVKLFMDGSGGARTAWMHEDWNKGSTDIDTGNRGFPLTDPEVYRQQVKLIHGAGIHVGTHAIGDRAIDWVVDTYTQVLKEKPTAGLRHSIIHANVPTDHAINTMAALQKEYDAGYPEAQAEFMYWIGDNYAGNFGPARCLRLMPFQTYVHRSVRWAGGSDFPVTPFAPRLGLWASIAREPLKGTYGAHPFGTAEAIDIHTALRSYTTWAARQLFLEDRIGSLEPGKDADIVVWDRAPYSIPTNQIKTMKCTLTMFQGEIVYQQN